MEGLSIKGLSIAFGGVQALNKVSLDVKPGEIVGLIGPNGAGKTSLINCISRYYRQSEGEIEFYGQNLAKQAPYHLPKLGISRSFQELNLPPDLSVLDVVMLGQYSETETNIFKAVFNYGYLKAEDRKYRRKARDTMRFFADVRALSERSQEELGYPDISGKGGYPDLLDVQDVLVGMLPYGIKKKLDLARAFASHPKLLMLDEPAAGLGAGDLDELVNLIKGIQKKFNTSVLLVEHNMSLVNRLCDRIVVLDFGKKIAEGTPAEIKVHPAVIEAYLGTRSHAATASSPTSASPGPFVAPDPVLELKGVDLHYGAVKALSGVSMKVLGNSITTVLGSNGAGKSSLMRAISGVERLSNGEILFKGERILHYLQAPRPDKIVRQGVVHVQEGRQIFKELSIMENLHLAGYTQPSRKRRAEKIEKVFHYFPKLKEKLKLKDAGNLSGGQQQMLAIGQGLMMDPKVLLLDEPSLGLSPILVEELFEIIGKISANEQCAILLVEQNVEMALRYSSYAYFLETGFLAKQGRSEELRRDDDIRKVYLGT